MNGWLLGFARGAPSQNRLRALRQRVVHRDQLRRRLGQDGAVALDDGAIPAGDRAGQRGGAALGPVGGGAQDERRQQLPRVLNAEPLDELRGGLLQRDQQVRGDRRAAW